MSARSIAGIGLVGLLALTGCSGGADGEDVAGGEGDLIPVSVAVIPIADTAPLWLGVDQGFFEDEGLDLTIETAGGGAAIVPGVVSGDFDFGFSNYVSLMFANSQFGADSPMSMTVVANGVTASEDLERDFGSVVVRADSDIETAADLSGRSVSVNTLANIGDSTVSYIVEEDGGDPSAIDFVEVGFPDAPAALENAEIDAAWIVEPFLTQAVDAGARILFSNFNGFDPELDIAGYFTSGQTLQESPEVVEAFRAAMNRSLQYAEDNPDEVRRILSTYTEISPELIEEIALPRFRAEVDLDAAQKLADAAVKFSGLETAPDLDSFFVLE
ncbi:ABC transporter substrate-binding protein [Salinibacterium sp. SYSU T00001]|uniref:ABC transporter substrate-binding protein n=1 Tax=Homoserinimonas sedimenticola TaxID=2986805 RepID=UPI0022359EEC|nr:ABC transporter substrate-binding protein [Salinibacterium sedimenticola]MCW4386677.1 ABC transporter substrate-binding protein [Salinibacterium sedimenticola]